MARKRYWHEYAPLKPGDTVKVVATDEIGHVVDQTEGVKWVINDIETVIPKFRVRVGAAERVFFRGDLSKQGMVRT